MTDWTSPGISTVPSDNQNNLMAYLHQLSGQEREVNLFEFDHSYSKPWNRHPDPNIKARPAKFLFMKHFPRHFPRSRYTNGFVSVDILDEKEDVSVNPFVAEVQALTPRTPSGSFHGMLNFNDASFACERSPVDKRSWTPAMNKLWVKVNKILDADRLARLVCDGNVNEIITKRNLLEKTASRLRQTFAYVVAWDPSQLAWLNSTLQFHIAPIFLVSYHEAMQLLRQKVPTLVDKFYSNLQQQRTNDSSSNARSKQMQSDPIQTVLNNYRPV